VLREGAREVSGDLRDLQRGFTSFKRRDGY